MTSSVITESFLTFLLALQCNKVTYFACSLDLTTSNDSLDEFRCYKMAVRLVHGSTGRAGLTKTFWVKTYPIPGEQYAKLAPCHNSVMSQRSVRTGLVVFTEDFYLISSRSCSSSGAEETRPSLNNNEWNSHVCIHIIDLRIRIYVKPYMFHMNLIRYCHF